MYSYRCGCDRPRGMSAREAEKFDAIEEELQKATAMLCYLGEILIADEPNDKVKSAEFEQWWLDRNIFDHLKEDE